MHCLNPQHSNASIESEVKSGGLHNRAGVRTVEVGYHLTEEKWRDRSSPELSLFASFAFQPGQQVCPHARFKIVLSQSHNAINRAEYRQVAIGGLEPSATALE